MAVGEMRYLRDQLPVVMAEDRGLDRFLAPFDQIAGELYEFIAAKELLFDLAVAPLEMVRYLAASIGVEIEHDLDESTQRRVALAAARTFPRRGTAASIEENVGALTGAGVRVVDPCGITISACPGVPDLVHRRSAAVGAGPSESDPPARRDDRSRDVVRVLLESFGHAPVGSIRAAIERELSCMVTCEIEISEEWPP